MMTKSNTTGVAEDGKTILVSTKKSPSLYKSDLEAFSRMCKNYNVYIGRIVEGGVEKIDIA